MLQHDAPHARTVNPQVEQHLKLCRLLAGCNTGCTAGSLTHRLIHTTPQVEQHLKLCRLLAGCNTGRITRSLTHPLTHTNPQVEQHLKLCRLLAGLRGLAARREVCELAGAVVGEMLPALAPEDRLVALAECAQVCISSCNSVY